jgi:hypothetical protein
MDTLIDQFALEGTGRFRAAPSADDVPAILAMGLFNSLSAIHFGFLAY